MNLPPNALHAFCNNTAEPCRVLGISTPLHQAFFDAVADNDKEMPFASLPFSEAMAQIAKIGAKHNMYFAPQLAQIGELGRCQYAFRWRQFLVSERPFRWLTGDTQQTYAADADIRGPGKMGSSPPL